MSLSYVGELPLGVVCSTSLTAVAQASASLSLALAPLLVDLEAAKTYWDGGWEKVRGVVISDRRVIDHDGWGPIGSAMNPKALLGNAITASSTAITVLGGGDAV